MFNGNGLDETMPISMHDVPHQPVDDLNSASDGHAFLPPAHEEQLQQQQLQQQHNQQQLQPFNNIPMIPGAHEVHLQGAVQQLQPFDAQMLPPGFSAPTIPGIHSSTMAAAAAAAQAVIDMALDGASPMSLVTLEQRAREYEAAYHVAAQFPLLSLFPGVTEPLAINQQPYPSLTNETHHPGEASTAPMPPPQESFMEEASSGVPVLPAPNNYVYEEATYSPLSPPYYPPQESSVEQAPVVPSLPATEPLTEDEIEDEPVPRLERKIKTEPISGDELPEAELPVDLWRRKTVDRELLLYNENHRSAMRAFFASQPKHELSTAEAAKARMVIHIDGVQIRVHRSVFLEHCPSLARNTKISQEDLKAKAGLSFRVDFGCSAADFHRFATFVYEGRAKVPESRIKKFLKLCVCLGAFTVVPKQGLLNLKTAVFQGMELPDAIDVNNVQPVLRKN